MAKRVVVPLNFGRKDKIAPKHAPHGVLASVKNLRHRELGGLGKRHGYQPATMTTRVGTLKAFDLFEFGGRLCALGSDSNDGFPAEAFEFLGLASEAWRSTGPASFRNVSINPFTNLIEVAGVPQAEAGTQHCDAACGGGYVCALMRSGQTGVTTAYVVDAGTNQTIAAEQLTTVFGSNVTFERIAFSAGSFYIVGARTSDNAIRIIKFTPGTSTSWAAFATVDGAVANFVACIDMVPNAHPTGSDVLLVAFDRVTATNLVLRSVTSAGALGAVNITIAGTSTQEIWIDGDETEGNILLFTIEGVNTAQLRTLNYASGLVIGPTTTLSGVSGSMCRLSRPGTDAVAVAVNNSSGDFSVQTFSVQTHGAENAFTIGRFVSRTRMVDGVRATTGAIVVGGIVTGDQPTNGLFYANASIAHLTTRDLNSGITGDVSTLTLDATTGRICWPTVHNPGGSSFVSVTAIPSVTMLDFRSTKRMQSARYGGLRYFAGGTPWVYDGRVVTESGFNEAPFIFGLVSSGAGGSLTGGATYTYTAHWEYTLSDGSIIPSSPALSKNITLGPADNRVSVTVGTPHSLRQALGATSYAIGCTLVISRTEWSPNTINTATGLPGAQFSQLRRAVQKDLVAGMSTYGQLVTVVENLSDAALSTQGVVYTQGPRGELTGPVPNSAPESCSYIAASESRLYNGGLVRPFEIQVSKEAFIGEPFEYSTLGSSLTAPAFYGIVSGAVIGVHALATARMVFTTDEILRLEPGSPDDEGAGDPLGLPVRVPAPSGLKDWRSLLEGPDGLWFQLDDDKLFRMPLVASVGTSGAPTWEGADIVDLLALFPTITATARHRQDNAGLFALNATNLQSARIAVRDFFFEDWFVDNPPLTASSGIEALVVFGRTAAYCSGGVVFVQSSSSFADNTATYIDSLIQTDPIFSFGLGGYGLHHDLLASVEYRGDCVLNARVSLDGGMSFTTLQSFNVTGFTVGQQLQYKWALPNNNTTSLVVELSDTTLGAPTEGLVYNEIDLLVEETDGALPELDPAFMA